jgi:hypothetical protein
MKARLVLWSDSEKKALIMERDDLRAFLDEFTEHPRGYEIVASKPLGQFDEALWAKLQKEIDSLATP